MFERPRFSKGAVRAFIGVTVALLLVFLTPQLPDLARVMGGGIGVALAPIALFVWFRVAQRIELDGEGITVVGRLGGRRYTWQDFAAKRARFPAYNWNDTEITTPVELASVTPLYEVHPPPRAGETTELALATFERVGDTDRFVFHLLEGLCFLRGHDPDGDWPRQAASIFAARERYGFAPERGKRVPAARVVPRA